MLQEGHWPVKTEYWFTDGGDLTGAVHVLRVLDHQRLLLLQ